MPQVQWGENMTQGMAPILRPALVGSTARNLAKVLVGQLPGETSCGTQARKGQVTV